MSSSLALHQKKAAFLKPDVDEVKINRNNMTRGKNYITNLLDFEVTSDVKEVMVTFEVETRVLACLCNMYNCQPVVFKRNLQVIDDGNAEVTIYEMLRGKKLDIGKVSTMQGKIAAKGDRLTIDIFEDFCCRLSKASVTVF